MFVPDNVIVPVPDFVIATVPLPFWITPEKVVDVLSPPAVKVEAVALEFVTVPPPASEPIVSAKPAKSKVPVAVSALPLGTELLAPSLSVPKLIVVAPP